ncbi:MAG: hypothetical protein WB679_16815 [Terracidiphilus sp.]
MLASILSFFLCRRYMKLMAAGKDQRKIVTAIGRELLGFIWAIGIKAEAACKPQMAARSSKDSGRNINHPQTRKAEVEPWGIVPFAIAIILPAVAESTVAKPANWGLPANWLGLKALNAFTRN